MVIPGSGISEFGNRARGLLRAVLSPLRTRDKTIMLAGSRLAVRPQNFPLPSMFSRAVSACHGGMGNRRCGQSGGGWHELATWAAT